MSSINPVLRMIGAAALVLGQAAAQPPELPAPPAPMPQELRMAAPSWEGQPAATGVTLAELEDLALRCNPSLAQAAARVTAARGHCIQVGLYPNPVAGYIGAEMGNEGRAGQQGGFLSQEVVTAGKLELNRSVAAQELRQAQYAWEMQRQRILTDVRRSFYDVLVAQRTVELTDQLASLSQESVKTIQTMMQALEAARGDILQARVEADTAKVLADKARNRYTAAWRNLAAVVGTSGMEPTPLAGDLHENLPQFTWDDTVARLATQSPQLASARAGVARARAALNRECAGRVPNIDLQAAVQYDNATEDTFATLEVGVPIPVYNRNQGNILRAQAELVAAQQETQKVELALYQRLAVVFEQYNNARDLVEKYSRDILPNAEESLKLTNSGYKQGEYGYLSVLTAQRTYFQTSLTYLDALRELRDSAATIEGNLLTGSLESGDALASNLSQ
ncbi:MAG: TolC family protein [Thermoguttaceae bacterium]